MLKIQVELPKAWYKSDKGIADGKMKNRTYLTTIIFFVFLLHSIFVVTAGAANKIMPLGDSITVGNASGVVPDDPTLYVSYRKALYDKLKAAGYADADTGDVFVGTLTAGSAIADFDPDHQGLIGWKADEIVNGGGFHDPSQPENPGKLSEWLAAEHPNIVLLHIGTNDVEFEVGDWTEVEAILAEIDAYEASPGGNPVWVVLALIIDQSPPIADVTNFNNDVKDFVFDPRQAGGIDKIILVDMQNGAGINYDLNTAGGDMFDDPDHTFKLHPFATGYDKMANLWFSALTQILPMADAGPDQSANESDTVILDGSGSTPGTNALNSNVLTFQWAQTAGTPVTLSDDQAEQPTFDVPAVAPAGDTLTFRLTVTDEDGLVSTGTVDIFVLQPPVAAAGPDQANVKELTQVTLNGTGSADSDGTIVGYEWVELTASDVALFGSDLPTATFTAPDVAAAGQTLTFQLTVTDDDGQTGTDTVNVAIVDRKPPVASAGADQADVKELTQVTLNGASSSDADGTIASYLWEQLSGPTVTLSNADIATASFTAPDVAAAGDTLTFQLTVTDDDGLQSSATVDVAVVDRVPPVADAGTDQTVDQGDAVTLNGSGSSDADGTIASYLWEQLSGSVVTLTNENTATAGFTAPDVAAAGETLTFRLTVTDNDSQTDSATVSVLVNDTPNPVADAGSNQTVKEGSLVTLDGSNSSDTGGTIVSYLWEQIAGVAALNFSGTTTSIATFTAPLVGTAGETLTFRLTVTDNDGLQSTATVTVFVNDENVPTADAGSDQTVNELSKVTLDGSNSSDADGAIVSYLWEQLSGTMVTLTNADTAIATFTAPLVGTAGETLTFQLTVIDNDSQEATDTVTITVNDPVRLTAAVAAVAAVAVFIITAAGPTSVFSIPGKSAAFPAIMVFAVALLCSCAATISRKFRLKKRTYMR